MKQFDNYFPYYENKMMSMIELPFVNNQVSFFIIIPKTHNISINTLVKQINSSTISEY